MRFLSDMRLFRLDYGEAHVAIRAGAAPQEPDNVVQPLGRMHSALYAARSYAEAHGCYRRSRSGPPPHHRRRRPREPRALQPLAARERAPEAITMRVTEPSANLAALAAGMGLGFCNTERARQGKP